MILMRPKKPKHIEKAVSLFPRITEREQLLIQIAKYNVEKNQITRNEYIDEYKQKYPDDEMTYTFEAHQYLGRRDYENAISEYEKIVDKDPGNALAYNMLGYLNYWQGNFDEALNSIRKYSVIAGKEANPHDSYGEILMYLGRYDEAIKEFEAADRIKPDLDFVLAHLGAVNREIGKYRDAIGYFERAKEFARNEIYAARAEEQVAYTLYLAGDNEVALDAINKLHEEHPEWYSVVGYRGIIAAGSDRLDIAYESLDELDTLWAKIDTTASDLSASDEKRGLSLISLWLEGKIALTEQRYQDAIATYQQAVDMAGLPDIVMARFLLGRSLFYAGELGRAEELLTNNLNDNPNHPYTLEQLAKVYKEQGNIEKQKQTLLMYLSVMSGADDDVQDVIEARQELDAITGSQRQPEGV
jgi:tetratricopeptide (TPR) repeat protein